MELKLVEELARVMRENDLTSLEVGEDGVKIKLERKQVIAAELAAALPDIRQQRPAGPFAQTAGEGAESSRPAAGTAVTSPTVGVFYTAPSPDSKPFVQVGDRVKKGDVLCIIEAMKLMNEITAEMDGTVTEICAENGQVVEFNQPLFRIV